MNKQALNSLLTSNFPHLLTNDQEKVIDALSRFFTTQSTFPLLIIKGYAGTGKTSMIQSIVQSLPEIKEKYVLLAPTGRAAKVMMGYTNTLATTIHKRIYYTDTSTVGAESVAVARNMHTNTTFIVDEASMIAGSSFDQHYGSNNLLEDLLGYVFGGNNCKLIFMGDTAQLPPIGTALSPALNKNYLKSTYNFSIGQVELTDVVRQNLDSGILFNATSIRNQLSIKNDVFPSLNTDFPDVMSITGIELEEELDSAYGKYGEDETVIICRSNKRANLFNQQVRSRIKWLEDEISTSDRLMVVKNNYYWLDNTSKAGFIANGDTVQVLTVKSVEEKYGFKFANVTIEFCDYPDEPSIEVKVLMTTIHVEAPALSSAENKALYAAIATQEYFDVRSKKELHQKLRADPYYNALQIKFAYAITCHKSQGGQWKAVFVDQGFLTEEMINEEYLRWLYTAVTRTTEKLYFVNFHPKFLGLEEDEF